jgi:hypothetical protein
VRAADQFHVGIVVDDLAATLAELTDLFGYEWCDEIGGPTPVQLPTSQVEVDFRFAYSRNTPRLEVIHSMPGTLWVPASGSGIHHIGYWSDDVAGDSATLSHKGFTVEAIGSRPDGTPYWAYHRGDDGPRVEIVSRTLEPALEQYWSSGSAHD